jgi:hypothetical protein
MSQLAEVLAHITVGQDVSPGATVIGLGVINSATII